MPSFQAGGIRLGGVRLARCIWQVDFRDGFQRRPGPVLTAQHIEGLLLARDVIPWRRVKLLGVRCPLLDINARFNIFLLPEGDVVSRFWECEKVTVFRS